LTLVGFLHPFHHLPKPLEGGRRRRRRRREEEAREKGGYSMICHFF